MCFKLTTWFPNTPWFNCVNVSLPKFILSRLNPLTFSVGPAKNAHSSSCGLIAQLVKVLPWYCRGHWFDSHWPLFQVSTILRQSFIMSLTLSVCKSLVKLKHELTWWDKSNKEINHYSCLRLGPNQGHS